MAYGVGQIIGQSCWEERYPKPDTLMALNATNAFDLLVGQELRPLSLRRDSVRNVVTAP